MISENCKPFEGKYTSVFLTSICTILIGSILEELRKQDFLNRLLLLWLQKDVT
jgi:hypothetical protein